MYYLFKIISDKDLDLVQLELEKKGLKDPFILEDQGVFIGGHSSFEVESENVRLVEKKPNEVDWEKQWADFSQNYHDGKAHIEVGDQVLELFPGAGFGDLSHPTTALMLEMLESKVPNEHVLDVGSGSGILTLASLLLNAKSAHGIDIDEEALEHAKKNAALNKLHATFSKNIPLQMKKSIFLMNMIFPEQKEFSPEKLNSMAKLWIVSGIMTKEREDYLNQAKQWNWILTHEFLNSDWLGFIFAPNKDYLSYTSLQLFS